MKWRMGLVAVLAMMAGLPATAVAAESCYAHIDYGKPYDTRPQRVLYVVIDQTVALPAEMKTRVKALVSAWGKPGDSVKIARFSANFRGKYPSLTFSGAVEPWPSSQYAHGLRLSDRQQLERCLQRQREEFGGVFMARLDETLAKMDPASPKTDIFVSLKQIAAQVSKEPARHKVMLLVSDGLENSDITTFYRRGNIRKISPNKEIGKLRRQGLIPNWHGARVYMYGMGLAPRPGQYVKSHVIRALSRFWDRYFVEGNARVVALGTPELLIDKVE